MTDEQWEGGKVGKWESEKVPPVTANCKLQTANCTLHTAY